ncbi:PTS sugar transporter subunit IIA [Biostraticola tofi]|uniref:PTS system IIA component (L-Asc family) n=1 Tax=Biostraticola tofi TaxID=466109 RepID=A0A4R3Z3Q9_9GAMM|nr:PTS sugar transporter subunit IIA [Biostraticola tofi]TCV99917.1 PTS system IIA component (L-Asc family) [Biostraticola tofi]
MANLTTWLNKERIQYVNTVVDWQEAIALVAEPLLKDGTITADYVANIIKGKQDLGPYFVIAPRIAMPHARPEQGALKLGLSLLKLRNGISFGSQENDPVDVIVMFAAPDKNSHVELISTLAEFLSDDDVMSQVFASHSQSELITVVNSVN